MRRDIREVAPYGHYEIDRVHYWQIKAHILLLLVLLDLLQFRTNLLTLLLSLHRHIPLVISKLYFLFTF